MFSQQKSYFSPIHESFPLYGMTHKAIQIKNCVDRLTDWKKDRTTIYLRFHTC